MNSLNADVMALVKPLTGPQPCYIHVLLTPSLLTDCHDVSPGPAVKAAATEELPHVFPFWGYK